jgi:hypothetical protein
MSTPDPIQMLIDAGALPQSPFDEASRYRGVPLALHPGGPGELPRPYVRRRFIAQRRDIAVAAEWLVTAGDRPELLAVTDPFELTDTPGARVVLPVPTAG